MSIDPLRIAYVEDDPDIREVTELGLWSVGGFEVDVCGSGQEALSRIPVFRPDLVILDVMMPGMDGLELFERLSRIDSVAKTPVIFMTARTREEEITEYFRMGAIGVILKPFDPAMLCDRVGQIWSAYLEEIALDVRNDADGSAAQDGGQPFPHTRSEPRHLAASNH